MYVGMGLLIDLYQEVAYSKSFLSLNPEVEGSSCFCVRIGSFVLRFYGPVNPMGSCRVWSVYLTTRLLGRLSPLSG